MLGSNETSIINKNIPTGSPTVYDNTRVLEEEKLRWNVVTEDLYKSTFGNVFQKLSFALARTLGPYGASTIIEHSGKGYVTTKDGWTVIKNIRFNNPIESNILEILSRISNRMVTKVGDGSTSAIIAANEFLKIMGREESRVGESVFTKYRRKDLNDNIQRIVNIICDKIEKRAIPVNEENFIDVVEKISNIATNENREFAKIIKDIYEKCGMSVNIRLELSPTLETTVRYEDGQYLSRMSLIDNIYINTQTMRCEIENPMIVMFDHSLELKHYNLIGHIYNEYAVKEGRRLVVIAPSFDPFILDKIKVDCERMIQQYKVNYGGGSVPFPIVYVRSQLVNNHYTKMYHDLASIIGLQVMSSKESDELRKECEAMAKSQFDRDQLISEGKHEEANAMEIDYSPIQKLSAFIGRIEKISIDSKENHETAFSGFNETNETLKALRMQDAKNEMESLMVKYDKEGFINSDYFDARNRYYRLSCNSATIYVGGSNELEKSNNKDAMDDAIKACVSALRYGYNVGGNIAILTAIEELRKDCSEKDSEFYALIFTTFKNVYKAVLSNKYIDNAQIESIVTKSVNENTCYNLITDEWDTDVINSSRTDIEILRGAISMVSVILTCNQYISKIVVKGE